MYSQPCSHLSVMDSRFDHVEFSKTRQWLLGADVAPAFLLEMVEQARKGSVLARIHRKDECGGALRG